MQFKFLAQSSSVNARNAHTGLNCQRRFRHYAVSLQRIAGREFPGSEVVALDDPRAAIPAEDRIVITGGAYGFGLFEPLHRLLAKFACTNAAFFEHGRSSTLVLDARVICAFVFSF